MSTLPFDTPAPSSRQLLFGNDILQVTGWGSCIMNGVGAATSESDGQELSNLGKHPVHHAQQGKKQHFFTVANNAHNNLALATFKDFVKEVCDISLFVGAPILHSPAAPCSNKRVSLLLLLASMFT